MLDQAALNAIGSGAGRQVHTLRAAPRLVLLIRRAVVSGIARVTRQIGAAELARSRSEAMDIIVLRRAGDVFGTASLLAGLAAAANRRLWLVSRLLGASKELTGRHLHELGLVGHEIGRDVGGEGEGRQRGEVLDEHCEILWIVLYAGSVDWSVGIFVDRG